MLGLGALVLVIAAVAAVMLTSPETGGGSSAAATSSAGTPTLAPGASALPAFVDPANDPAVGLRMPEAAGSSFDGSPVRIAADGRPKILLFLTHWCPHCQAEVPVVQRWLDAGGLPRAVDLLSIATSIDPTRPNYPPDTWLRLERWTPPVLVDPHDAVARQFGLTSFPYWVVVEADGSVATRLTGELTPTELDALAATVAP